MFDFLGEYVLTTGHDHVVLASLDEQAALLVEVPEVAGTHQPARHPLGAAVGVAAEEHRIGDEDPTPRSRRYRHSFLSRISIVVSRSGLPAVLGDAAKIGGACEGAVRDLGGAVEVVHDVAERVHEVQDEPAGQRGAADGHVAQGSRVVLGTHRFGDREDASEHHWHRDQSLGTVRRDRRQRGLRVEAALQHGRPAQQLAEGKMAEAPGVEQRRGDHA